MTRPDALDVSLSVEIGAGGEFLAATGPWKAVPAGQADGAALTTWRVDLPSEPLQQQKAMLQAEREVQILTDPQNAAALRQKVEVLRGQLADLQRLLGQNMQVETSLDGRRVARTVLRWSGDMETTWYGSPTPEQAARHFSVVRLSLHSYQGYWRLWGKLAPSP